MGLGGISIWQLAIVLLIVVLVFGTKKLSGMGSDLGGAVKGFRKAMGDADADADEEKARIDNPDAEFSEAADSTDKSAGAEQKQNT